LRDDDRAENLGHQDFEEGFIRGPSPGRCSERRRPAAEVRRWWATHNVSGLQVKRLLAKLPPKFLDTLEESV